TSSSSLYLPNKSGELVDISGTPQRVRQSRGVLEAYSTAGEGARSAGNARRMLRGTPTFPVGSLPSSASATGYPVPGRRATVAETSASQRGGVTSSLHVDRFARDLLR